MAVKEKLKTPTNGDAAQRPRRNTFRLPTSDAFPRRVDPQASVIILAQRIRCLRSQFGDERFERFKKIFSPGDKLFSDDLLVRVEAQDATVLQNASVWQRVRSNVTPTIFVIDCLLQLGEREIDSFLDRLDQPSWPILEGSSVGSRCSRFVKLVRENRLRELYEAIDLQREIEARVASQKVVETKFKEHVASVALDAKAAFVKEVQQDQELVSLFSRLPSFSPTEVSQLKGFLNDGPATARKGRQKYVTDSSVINESFRLSGKLMQLCDQALSLGLPRWAPAEYMPKLFHIFRENFANLMLRERLGNYWNGKLSEADLRTELAAHGTEVLELSDASAKVQYTKNRITTTIFRQTLDTGIASYKSGASDASVRVALMAKHVYELVSEVVSSGDTSITCSPRRHRIISHD